MVMALMVLLGFGLLFMFASDEVEGGGQSIESVISHQAKEIDGHQANIIHERKKLDQAPLLIANSKELARFKREIQSLKNDSSNLTKRVEMRQAEIALTTQALADYKDHYRA